MVDPVRFVFPHVVARRMSRSVEHIFPAGHRGSTYATNYGKKQQVVQMIPLGFKVLKRPDP